MASLNKVINTLVVICLAANFFFYSNASAQTADTGRSPILLADPAIFNSKGTYYLYGTVEKNANKGFLVYTSTNMEHWKSDTNFYGGYALKKGDSYGKSKFWAPQVFAYQETFYMAYVADENIAIAKSIDPKGPFIQATIKQLDAPVKQIDPFVFIDGDGKKYLYHVRLTNGNKIFVALMKDDFSAIDSSTLKECITVTSSWENTASSNWPVTEGPSVIKHNNLYYLFYTANDFRNPDYAVGYAISKTPYGPWEKYAGNPIISRKILGINGTGHGDFFVDNNHQLTYVFHTHFSNTAFKPRRTAIIKVSFVKDKKGGADVLMADKKSFHFFSTAEE
jgi:xylan 1,4-beta-xylosidase